MAERKPFGVEVPHSGAFGALLRIPIPYLLEVYESGALSYIMTLPQNPQRYEQKRPSATVITHTLNEVVRELTENHLVEIQLSGVSGRAERLGNTRTGRVAVLNGREILEEFDAFLDRYQERGADTDSYMVFRALDEGQSYRVEPMDWSWSEDASRSRFSYDWTLRLEAYAHAQEPASLDVFPSLSKGLQIVSEKISELSAYPALAGNVVRNVGDIGVDVLNGASEISRLATGIQSAADAADGVRTFISETLPLRILSVSRKFESSINRLLEVSGLRDRTEWSRQRDDTLNAVSNLSLFVHEGLTAAGLLGVRRAEITEDTSPTVSNTNPIVQTTRALVRYTIRAGDTLQSIALRAYGDSSRWTEIANANGMRGSRYLSDGRTLSVGDTILVPRGTVTNAPPTSAYGTDFKLSADGDLVFTSDGDLATVSGLKNLEQALRNRLLTTLGSCWLMPEYGLPLRLGSALTAQALAHSASHVRDQLVRETRIDTVQRVQILQEGDKIAVEVDIQPIEGESTTIITPYLGS